MIDFTRGSRDRRTLVAGAGIVLSLLLIGRGVPAWYRWRAETMETMSATLAEVSAARTSVDHRHSVTAAIQRMNLFRMQVEPALVSGSGRAQAVAALASVVGEAATTSGLRMGALEAVPEVDAADSGAVRRVGVRGEASGDVRAVARFLAAVESGLPLLAVREFSVTRGEMNPPTGGAQSLHMDFVVEGLAQFKESEQRQ